MNILSGRKSHYVSFAGVAVLGIIGVGLFLYLPSRLSPHETVSTATSSVSNQKPTFAAVIPKSKSISDLGGWKQLTSPNGNTFYAYTDTIGDAKISVTQQQLPDSFKTNTDYQVSELAKQYYATDKIDVGGAKAYIGTSSKGPQSVIFSKKNLLIFLKSDKTLPDDTWKRYIAALN